MTEGTHLGDPVGPRTGRKDAWADHLGSPPVGSQSVFLWAIALLCVFPLGHVDGLRRYNYLCTHQVLPDHILRFSLER